MDEDMDATNKCVLNGDGSEVSDGSLAKQQSTSIKLSKFPKELLEQILIHLDNKNMLMASHVCKSFAAAAESAFAQKYANKCYLFRYEQRSFDKVMVTKYGGKLQNISVAYEDEEILPLIEWRCCNLKRARLHCSKMIPRLMGLKELRISQTIFSSGLDMNRNTFAELINNNPELEDLDIGYIEDTILDLMDERLDMLTKLSLRNIRYVANLPKISLQSLETLTIDYCDADCCISILQAMNGNAIKELRIEYYNPYFQDRIISSAIIQEICLFKTLVSLRLHECGSSITKSQLRKLAIELPHLTTLSIQIETDESSSAINILSVLPILPKLTKLTIKTHGGNFAKLLTDLDMSIYEFHARFAKVNAEIKMYHSNVSITKDYIIVRTTPLSNRSNFYTFEVHWMDNLNENTLRKTIDWRWNCASKIKFINNCADQTLDMTTFMHLDMNHTKILDIKSNGRIAVNANATRYPGFFPKLKVLKIQLDNHSAIDFLHNLDKRVCRNIQTLWLNTNGIHANQGVAQGADMMTALAKFENLKSLHMTSSSGELNTEQLFSVCPKLDDLQVQREW